jgi:SAM-dependent methyltransferase
MPRKESRRLRSSTMAARVRGTQGYEEQAAELVQRYEALDFADKHRDVLEWIPATATDALDVGAGTGADAAWLAGRGHRVTAVEPTEALRSFGMARHAASAIRWLDDSLPALARVARPPSGFRLVMLTAVWMHLDAGERRVAMARLASLLADGGVLLMAIRHGAVPAGRVMFDVSAEETIALAASCGLECVASLHGESIDARNRAAGVTWTRLAFRRGATASLH